MTIEWYAVSCGPNLCVCVCVCALYVDILYTNVQQSQSSVQYY